ncbi:hypothetical protein Tco_0520027 [Tanacetum coccineum]
MRNHHLYYALLERVPLHTTAPTSEDAIIPLPTPDEIVASLPDSRLVKKSKGHSQASRPSKRRKLQKKELRKLVLVLRSWIRPKGCFGPTPRLGKRLGPPPSIVVTSVSDPSHIGSSTLLLPLAVVLSPWSVVAGGRVRKSEA